MEYSKGSPIDFGATPRGRVVASRGGHLAPQPKATNPQEKHEISSESESEWSSEDSQADSPEGFKCVHKARSYTRGKPNSPTMKLVEHTPLDVLKVKTVSSVVAKAVEIVKPTPLYQIPKPKLVRLLMFDVKIVHFVDFDHFFICKISSKVDYDLSKLHNQMQNFYREASGTPVHNFSEGSVCAVADDGIWHRGIIKRLGNEQELDVFLVDVGKFVTADKKNVKQLNDRFIKEPAAAIKCCLADIKPKKENGMKYPGKAVKEFKKLAIDSGNAVRVLLKEVAAADESNPAIVYVFPGNTGVRVNINAMMVEWMDCAISTGSDSLETLEPDPYPCKLRDVPKQKKDPTKTHMEVEILHIVSPNEFYAALKDHKEEIDKLHSETKGTGGLISKFRKLQQTAPKETWNVGDNCLVSHPVVKDGAAEWSRATVLEKSVEPSIYGVFLIDRGIRAVVSIDQMFEPHPGFHNTPPIAVRMHIPNASPAGGTKWTISALDLFKQIISNFESICVSLVGDKDEKGSLPVLVWGVVIEKSPFAQQSRFHNIANHIVLEGYMDGSKVGYQELEKVERPVSDKDFGWVDGVVSEHSDGSFSTISDDAGAGDVTLGDLTIELKPHSISSWIPPDAQEKFIGIPTNVDENGIIYIHSEKQDKILEDMKSMITKIYTKVPKDSHHDKVTVGQPVIVFNFLDSFYYRAQVESLPTGKKLYKVKFIDYGTVYYVRREDIFSKVVASSVPIMTKKYRLSQVVPLKQHDNEWPATTLDLIHEKIVDNKVEISVKTGLDDVNECSIRILDDELNPTISIEKLLIEQQLAKEREPGDAWPSMKKIVPGMKTNWYHSDLQRYEQEMKEREFGDLMDKFLKPLSVVVPPEETRAFLKKHVQSREADAGESLLSFKSSYKGFVRRPMIAPAPPAIEDNYPLNSRRGCAKRLTPQIPFFDLQLADVGEFWCEFASIVDEKIFLVPNIPELKKNQQKMDTMLSEINTDVLSSFRHPERAETKLCLANDGNGWKRGTVVKLLERGRAFEVFLVDTAKTGIFEVKQVRHLLDKKLIDLPRQTLAVSLNGVAINKKIQDPERVFMQLSLNLEAKEIRAVVKGYDVKDYPLVDLFYKDGKLAYQRLVDKNYFINC